MAPLKLTILDPTSLTGRAIAEQVAAAMPHLRRQLFHTGPDSEHVIAEVASEAALVPALTDPDELEGSVAVIVSSPPPPALAGVLLDWLRRHPETALIDATQPGLAASESLVVVGHPPLHEGGRRWYQVADPSLVGPASVLRALARLEPRAVHLTVLAPASGWGSDAIQELATQAAARLSGSSPKKPAALPGVLAFDLQPASPIRQATLDNQLEKLFPALDRRLLAVETGVFHGNVASLMIGFAGDISLERVRSLIRSADQVRLARANERVRPSDIAAGDLVVCSELRVRGAWLSTWVAADGMRLGAAVAVPETLAALTAS